MKFLMAMRVPSPVDNGPLTAKEYARLDMPYYLSRLPLGHIQDCERCGSQICDCAWHIAAGSQGQLCFCSERCFVAWREPGAER